MQTKHTAETITQEIANGIARLALDANGPVAITNSLETFTWASDSGSGTVRASSLDEAYDKLRAGITDAMVDDGATLWVEAATGERLTLGIDGD